MVRLKGWLFVLEKKMHKKEGEMRERKGRGRGG
jgi:hypothetical protein